MAGKLPTVTEYIKNVGKSIGYSAIDTIESMAPQTKDFIETNEDLFKTMYGATKNYKRTVRQLERGIKKTKLYEAFDVGWKNLKEDLSTGKWYNKERDTINGMQSLLGDDFTDFGEFSDDFNLVDYAEEHGEEFDFNSKAQIAVMAKSSANIGNTMISISEKESKIMSAIGTGVMSGQKAIGNQLFAQTEKLHMAMAKGFSGVNAGVETIKGILNGPFNNYMNESTKFYGDVSNRLANIEALLKESTEMSRNIYKRQEKEYKAEDYENIVGSGMPNLSAYKKKIYKNLQALDPTGGMFFGNDDMNIFKMFAGSPLKFITDITMKKIIPSAMKKAVNNFDEALSGLFPAFIARMNNWAENSEYSDGGLNIKGIIGSLLGIKTNTKLSIDPSKYHRGPIPFDGETKKSIVEVIPGYLARIESAIAGTPERAYDYKAGRFKSLEQLHKEYRESINRFYMDAMYPINDIYEKFMNDEIARKYKPEDFKDREKYIKKQNEEAHKFRNERRIAFGKLLFESMGDFQPFMGMGDKHSLETNPYAAIFDDDKQWLRFVNNYLMKKSGQGKYSHYNPEIVKTLMGMPRAANEARINARKYIEGLEDNGNLGALVNGQYVVVNDKGKIVSFDTNKDKYSKDNRIKNISDYVRDILANIEFIRKFGMKILGTGGITRNPDGSISGFGGYGTGSMTSIPKFEDFYKENKYNEDMQSIEESIGHTEFTRTIEREKEDEKNIKKMLKEKYGLTGENIFNTIDKSGRTTSTMKRIRNTIDDLLRYPTYYITEKLNTGMDKMLTVIFGDPEHPDQSFRQIHGIGENGYQSMMEFIVGKFNDTFDKLQEGFKNTWDKFYGWFKETSAGKWMINQWNNIKGNVKYRLGEKLGFIRDRGLLGLDNTFGRAYRNLSGNENFHIKRKKNINDVIRETAAAATEGKILTREEAENSLGREFTPAEASKYQDVIGYGAFDPMMNMAKGGVVKKYGAYMLSPGETVIPNADPRVRKRNLIEENKVKNRLFKGFNRGRIGNYAEGTINQKAENGVPEWEATKKVMKEINGQGADIAASAIIGSGLSLVTGMIGGPLLGAAAGAGVGIISNSETAKTALFGKMVDGERQGGLISKNVIDWFKKNKDDMIDFGLAGGVLGLLTPFGIVGGTMLGAALGYAKNTQGFNDFMFGNKETGAQGIIENKEEFMAKIKKALPRMGIGAGAFGLLGLGPFGFIGNAMIGAGVGLLSTSESFKTFMFGEMTEEEIKDENGNVIIDSETGKAKIKKKRYGGLLGVFRDGVINPLLAAGKNVALDLKDYAKNHIIKPTTDFFKGSARFIKNTIQSIGDRIADGANNIFEKAVGTPVSEWLRENVFKRASKAVSLLAKLPYNAAKFTIGAPFALLGGIGNQLTAGAIRHGRATDMSAQERLDFRNQHRIRFSKLNPFNIFRKDRSRIADEGLVGMSAAELGEAKGMLDTLINSRNAREDVKNFNNARKEIGDRISNFLYKYGIMDAKHLKLKSNILRILRNNQYHDITPDMIINELNRVGIKDSQLQQEFLTEVINIDEFNAIKDKAYKEINMDNEVGKNLEKIFGIKFGRQGAKGITGIGKFVNGFFGGKGYRETQRMLNAEYNRKLAAEKQKSSEENIADDTDKIASTTVNILNVLRSLNNYVVGDKKNSQVFNEDGSIDIKGTLEKMKNDTLRSKEDNKAYAEAKNILWKEYQKKFINGTMTDDDRNNFERAFNAISYNNFGEKLNPGSFVRSEPWKERYGKGAKGVYDYLKQTGALGNFLASTNNLINKNILSQEELERGSESGSIEDIVKTFSNGVTVKRRADGDYDIVNGDKIIGKMKRKNSGNDTNSGNVKESAGILTGDPKNILKIFKNGTRIEKTEDGYALVKGDKVISVNKVSTKVKKAIDGVKKKVLSPVEVIKDKLDTFKEFLFGKIKSAKEGLGNTFRFITNSLPFKIVKGAGMLLLFASLAGHASEFVKTKVVPFFKNTIGKFLMRIWEGEDGNGGIKNLAGTIYSKLANKFPEWFGEGSLMDKVKSTIGTIATDIKDGTFIGNLTTTLWDKFKEGLELFKNNILIPAWNFAAPRLQNMIYNAIHGNNTFDDFIATKGKRTVVDAIATYKDENGNLTTQATYTDKNGVTHYNKLVDPGHSSTEIARVNNGFFNKAKAAGMTKYGQIEYERKIKAGPFEFVKYTTDSGNIIVRCNTTMEYLKISRESGIIEYGQLTDKSGTPGFGYKLIGWLDFSAGTNIVASALNQDKGFMYYNTFTGGVAGYKTILTYDMNNPANRDEITALLIRFGFIDGDLDAWQPRDILYVNDSEDSKLNTNVTRAQTNGKFNPSRVVNTNSKATNSRGKGRGGQQGGIYSLMRYGNSTIGESGCAPVAADMILSGRGIPDAARYAQSRGYVGSDGSTSIGFFGDYFNSKGINSYTTTDKSDISRGLSRGQSAVMLGRDPGGGIDSAYSNANHYITAKQISGNKVLVNDPALGKRIMPKSKILRNAKAGVLTGGSRDSSNTLLNYVNAKNSNTKSSNNLVNYVNKTTGVSIKVGKDAYSATTTKNNTSNKTMNLGDLRAEYYTNTYKGVTDLMKEYIWSHWTRSDGGAYGAARNENGKIRYHAGLDLSMINDVEGAPVKSFTDGEVYEVSSSNSSQIGGRGHFVVIRDGKGFFHIYQHLSAHPSIRTGAKVKVGDVIGKYGGSGSSGVRRYGLHLHYEIRRPEIEEWAKTNGKTIRGSNSSDGYIYSIDELNFKTINPYDYLMGQYQSHVFSDGTYTDNEYGSIDDSDDDKTAEKAKSLFDKIIDFGKLLFKKRLGENAYNYIFGGKIFDSLFSSDDDASIEKSDNEVTTPFTTTAGAADVWKALRRRGYSPQASAAIMGNFQRESGNRTHALEGDFLSSAPISKAGSKEGLDDYAKNWLFGKYKPGQISKSGYYSNGKYFPGMGLAQWTGPRGEKLFDYAVSKNSTWTDPDTQIGYFDSEMNSGYSRVKNYLMNGKNDINDYTKYFLSEFEGVPGNHLSERQGYARDIYNKYRTMRVDGADLRNSGTGRDDINKNRKWVNDKYTGGARDDIGSTKNITINGGVSNDAFIKSIIALLTTIADNSDMLNTIVNILSKNNISGSGRNDTTSGISEKDINNVKASKNQARKLLNKLMENKSNAENVANILQQKDNTWLINAMASIAGE